MKPETRKRKEAELLEAKLLEVRLLERRALEKKELPHLYGWKWYPWAKQFFDSVQKENLLCAANQISKSSTQMRKCIHWATDKSIWPKLWPHMRPNQFWYLYPNKDVATAEYYTKWVQFLPQGSMKDDPIFGWHPEFERKQIKALHFNSGVVVYFKSYSQDVGDLQTGTVFAMFCDEELPVELLGELQSRLNATDGFFHMVFTATLGQDYWRRAIEPRPDEEETHPDAFKQQISLYQCLTYEDGSKSHWTEERIERIKRKCTTTMDMLIRVYGKFAKIGGRKFECYDESINRSENHPLPKDWLIYSGVDIGSGGEKGHPAAIVFIAVDPFFRRGRVFRAWRGDKIRTESGDILVKYIELRGTLKPVLQCYDFASAEFRMVSESAGESFEPAEKKHEVGEKILNTLFKHKMLSIQTGDSELDKLSGELMALLQSTPKKEAIDDLCDALRYAATKIPWDFSALDGLPIHLAPQPQMPSEQDQRRGLVSLEDAEKIRIEEEFDEWNEQYDA